MHGCFCSHQSVVVLTFVLFSQAPSPGVSGYFPMLPHSETTLSHVLLPLPTYPTAKHPQVRLDPKVMTIN